MCQGFTDEWCSLPRCKELSSLEKLAGRKPPRADFPPSLELQREQMSARIDSGEGYWSTRRQKKRYGFYAVKRPLGYAFPECRNSMRGQALNLDTAASEIAAFVARIAADDSITDREKKSIMFSCAVAGDHEAKTNGYSSYLGLYRDEPPMMKRPSDA